MVFFKCSHRILHERRSDLVIVFLLLSLGVVNFARLPECGTYRSNNKAIKIECIHMSENHHNTYVLVMLS